MTTFKNQFDFCPWLFWRQASEAEQAEQLAQQAALAATGCVTFGERAYISPLAGFVPAKVRVGDGSYIAGYAYVTEHVVMGAHCTINPYTVVRGQVTMGDGVRIGAHANVLGFNHNHADVNKPIYQQGVSAKGIVIGDDVWIGSAATILDGVTVGSHCLIAAGAVVTRDVPDYAVVAGNPARMLRDRRSGKVSKTMNNLTFQALRQFGENAAAQWPDVLKRCETRWNGLPDYVDTPDKPARNVARSVRPLNDAIEIAAAFGGLPPIQSRSELIARLQACQDPDNGMPFDPLQPGCEQYRHAPMTEGNTIYMVLSVGYALACLGSQFKQPLQAVHEMPIAELRQRLTALPWQTGAWGAGAWVDAFGTALWMNRHYFGLDGPIAPLFEWLAEACKPYTGLWGDATREQGWLQPVNGFYRLTRGSYCHFGLRVPHPEAAVDTILAHIRLNGGFEDKNINACNLLDTIHPFWLLLQQTSHRRDEMMRFIERQIPLMLARWVDGQGFGFAPSDSPGLQGSEMWLSVIYIAADALGMADALGYSPKGVHWLRPPE